MDEVTTLDRLEAIIGTPSSMVLLKAVDSLDEGCRAVLGASSVAGFGFRDREGVPHTTLVGGTLGFARIETPTRIDFDLGPGQAGGAGPVVGGGVSLVFLVAGIGEMLRLNGRVAELTGPAGTAVSIDVDETYVHCARCILRSALWEPVDAPDAPVEPVTAGEAPGPLADPAVTGFLESSPFLILSSWDRSGASDTSPRGDGPGFVQVLDAATLAIPDRRGNKRADTFRNLLGCDQLSLAALVPGRDDVLHVSGAANMSEDAALLSTMRVGGITPKAALVVRVQRADLVLNDSVRASALWDASVRSFPPADLNLNQVAAQHLSHNQGRGATASMARVLAKGLLAAPSSLSSRAMEAGYRKALKDEGY